MNKKGAIPAPVIVIGGVVVFLLLIFAIGWGIKYYSNPNAVPVSVQISKDNTKTIAQLTDKSPLGFLTYVFGRVPDGLVEEVGATAAIVVTVAIFIMLVVGFGDILSAFSAFSETSSWILGALLAIISANFKGVMAIAVLSFGIVGGVGVISIGVGLAVPFLVFIFMHFFLAKYLVAMVTNKINIKNRALVTRGANDVAGAIEGFKTAASAFKK